MIIMLRQSLLWAFGGAAYIKGFFFIINQDVYIIYHT